MSSLTGLNNLDEETTNLLMKLWTPNFNLVKYLHDFRTRKTAIEKVDFALGQLRKCKLLPNLIRDCKSDELSKEQREEGNDMFKMWVFDEAYNSYLSAILLAKSKETLSLAYANRSSVLFKSHMYQDCIKDVNRALSLGYPEHRKNKLLFRKNKAASRIDKSTAYHEPIPQIPGENKHPQIQCATKAIKIVSNHPKFGTHIVAAKNLSVGDVLLIEKPCVSMTTHFQIEDYDRVHCDECNELCFSMIPCDGCTRAAYCGNECKQTAFEKYHKYECSILRTILGFLPFSTANHFVLALRMAFQLRDRYNEFSDKSQNTGNGFDYRDIFRLKNCFNYTLPEKQLNIALITAKIYHLVKTCTNFFSESPATRSKDVFKDILFRCVFISNRNCRDITEIYSDDIDEYSDEDETEEIFNDRIAHGLYPLTSLLTHACVPNVVPVAYGNTLIVKAASRIKKGEKCLAISSSHLGPLKEASLPALHRISVFKSLFMVCSCKKCLPESWNIHPTEILVFEMLHIPERAMHMVCEATSDLDEVKKLIQEYAKETKALDRGTLLHLAFSNSIWQALQMLGNNRAVAPKIKSCFDF